MPRLRRGRRRPRRRRTDAPPESGRHQRRRHNAPTEGDATHGGVPGGELTEFLSAPQQPDELGCLGKYRMLKILGRGGMGVVFKAEDPTLRRSVALKAMLPAMAASASAGKRFLRKAQAMAAVEHDHVVRVYQADEERGVPFLAMEFLKGEPLDQRIDRDGKLPTAEVLRIGREIAEGLAAAHATGLIHRDIKPANVWLESPRDRVKILDFGLARAVSEDSGLTQTGAIMGTPAYMAPEQARGEPVDTRCDLFSLGVLLYRLCTGKQPFKGKDAISTIVEVATHEPPPPRQIGPDVPPGVSDLIMRLLEKDAVRRPASAQAVVEAIRALEEKPVGGATPPRPDDATAVYEPPSAPRAKRRKPLLIAVAALLALVPLGWWLASVFLRVKTDKGTLIVEINDAETEARVKNGKLILTGPDGKVRYTLTPGERDTKIDAGSYSVRVEGADGLSVDTPEFTIKQGDKVTVRVTAGPPEKWVPLFNGKNLGGWTVDSGAVARWAVEDGQIVGTGTGSAGRGWLLSDKPYSDFHLRLEFQADAGADGALGFRAAPGEKVGTVPQHPAVKITGHGAPDRPYSGALYYAPNTWEQPAGAARSKEGVWNKLGVRVVGDELRVWINGEEVQKLALDKFAANPNALPGLKRTSGRIGLQQHTGKVRYREIEINDLSAGKPAVPTPTDFRPLFNGKDLAGWVSPKGGTGRWTVRDGAITCSGPQDHLGTIRGDFTDFHLRTEVKLNKDGNSGIYFRAGRPVGILSDYEAQICTVPTQQKTGSLQNLVKVPDILVPPDTWFTYEVIARGNRIRLLVNGTKTVDYAEKRPGRRRAGYLHLQHHDPATEVHFRKIEVKLFKP